VNRPQAAAPAMPDEQYTRCPGCKTIFRVTPPQLAARAGQVRCGHCRLVFDGNANLISLVPPEPGARFDRGDMDEAALGPPTITLRNATALAPATAAEEGATIAPDAVPAGQAAAATDAVAEIPYEERFAWASRKKRGRNWSVLQAAAAPLLVLLLLGQAVFHFRDGIVARWPSTRPALTQLCQLAGCSIRPLNDVGALAIDSSDLQADPAHRGLLILTATIRNRAAWPLAYPDLELTLTDAQDQVVVRRALGPAEYAGGTADLAAGIAPNGEIGVKLFIDASATNQAGYRLYLFYP
jgi:predicted Zn finger-like uncharacterized protein